MGGDCEGGGVNYELECLLGPENRKSVYIGESSRNLYTRSKEHLSRYRQDNISSFIRKHQDSEHGGQEPDYKARVIGRSERQS